MFFFKVLIGLFTVAWIVWFTAAAVRATDHPSKPPAPVPWSCSQINAEYAPIDAGGQIAPLCGQQPYGQ